MGRSGAAPLLGNQREQEFLEALALCDVEAGEVNAHLIAAMQADDGAGADDGASRVTQVQADIHGGADRDDSEVS
jgi:hypothetical protein